jgi:predicted aldo/keto reductase-like oxidoreductase
MKTNQRREFLKKSLTGISAASLFPGVISASIAGVVLKLNSQQDFVYRMLGRTGLKLPVISMGTSNINNPGIISAAIDAGIKLLTTSSYYGEGNNELMLSGVFKGRPRDSFLIATSSRPEGMDNKNGIFTDPNAVTKYIADIEGGLKRLGLDYVDILFLPFTAKRESVFFEPFLRMMENFKKQGKARFIGTTTHSFCDEAVRAAADTKIYDMVLTSYNFRTEKMQEINDALVYAANAGLGIIGMKSQAGGFWDKERKQPINSQATIKWVLQNENITTVLSGMSTLEQLQQNIALMTNLKLNQQEKNDLRLTSADRIPGLYCQQCSKCIPQCHNNYDIPTAMRSFMYAYGYKDLRYAKETLGYAKIPANPCEGCDKCNINCTMGFDVRAKVQDIARLNNVPDEFLPV